MALHSEVSEEVRKKLFSEINETHEGKTAVNLAIMKQWIKSQPHLPQNYDEKIVEATIRGCKHNLEIAKKKIDCLYSYRTLMPELFDKRDPTAPGMKIVREHFIVLPLPNVTPDGCRVTLHKAVSTDPSLIDTADVCKYMTLLGEIRVMEEVIPVKDIYVFDFKEVKPSHVYKIFNPVLKKALLCATNCYPLRMKEIHIVNSHPFLETAIGFIKMILKPKIRERLQVHSGVETLFKYIPREIFPSDYGGQEKSVEALMDDWDKKMESYSAYFREQESVKSDESKRINKKHTALREQNELFGTSGSFHKLNID